MTKLQSTEDHIIHKPSQIEAYSIRKRDWDKIRSDIIKTVPKEFNYEGIALACLTLGIASLLSIATLSQSENVPNWAWILHWVIASASLIISIVFFLLNKNRKPQMQMAAQEIAGFMDDIITEINVQADNLPDPIDLDAMDQT